MEIPVLIEPVGTDGYRARGGAPFAVTAEGATEEEVLRKLRETIAGMLQSGARIVTLQVAARENAWLRLAGMFDKDDPLVKDWLAIMQDNRLKEDREEATP